MARGRKSSLIVTLTGEERIQLEHMVRSTTIRAGHARRARIVLLRAEGQSFSEIVRRVGVQRRVVYQWVRRFQQKGPRGLGDKPGRGRTPVFSPRGGCPPGQAGLRKTG
jgi:hypothetical protein